MKEHRKLKAFTLNELMVVLIIIGILVEIFAIFRKPTSTASVAEQQ